MFRSVKEKGLAIGLVFVAVAAFGFPRLPPVEGDRCLQCHGSLPPTAPRSLAGPDLGESFSMSWKMFELPSQTRPPLGDARGTFLPGQTFYDWDSRRMTEIYPEKCIDIFSSGRDFPCQFTSRGNETFLIRFQSGDPRQVNSCCRWSQSDFWAPRPDVLKNMGFDRQLALGGRPADWWLLDIPLPGPFGYATLSGTDIPGAFWFPVLSGWVQQNFSGYSTAKPDPEIFQLPTACEGTIPVCEGS